MSEQKLKLVKAKKNGVKQSRKPIQSASQLPGSTSQAAHQAEQPAAVPVLSPEEQAEAAKFRAFTQKRAAHQARVRQLFNKLKEQDDAPKAA